MKFYSPSPMPAGKKIQRKNKKYKIIRCFSIFISQYLITAEKVK